VDFRRTVVVREGKPVLLSAREFQLLRFLIDHRGDTLSRETLLTEVWGYDAMTTTRTVDVHVAWLRQKLEDNPKLPQLILTIRGLGYKFTG
jgi:two-component system alkaline phosphatase synthesis response regulator PhoP